MSNNIQELIDAANGKGFTKEQLAGMGLLLARHRKVVDDALEVVKNKLRQEAIKNKEEGKSFVNIDGQFIEDQNGFIQVTFMEPTLRLKKGVDASTVPNHEQYFTSKVVYVPKKDLQSLLEGSGVSIFDFFELREPLPRVGFRDKPKVK